MKEENIRYVELSLSHKRENTIRVRWEAYGHVFLLVSVSLFQVNTNLRLNFT